MYSIFRKSTVRPNADHYAYLKIYTCVRNFENITQRFKVKFVFAAIWMLQRTKFHINWKSSQRQYFLQYYSTNIWLSWNGLRLVSYSLNAHSWRCDSETWEKRDSNGLLNVECFSYSFSGSVHSAVASRSLDRRKRPVEQFYWNVQLQRPSFHHTCMFHKCIRRCLLRKIAENQ